MENLKFTACLKSTLKKRLPEAPPPSVGPIGCSKFPGRFWLAAPRHVLRAGMEETSGGSAPQTVQHWDTAYQDHNQRSAAAPPPPPSYL